MVRAVHGGRWRRTRRAALAVALVTVAALAACSGPEDKAQTAREEREAELRSSTTEASENPCSLTSPQEVDGVFGGPVAATLGPGGACTYEVRGGVVSLSVSPGDPRPLSEMLPDAQPVPDLGDGAVWSASGEEGGVLAVRTPGALGLFDVQLRAAEDEALGKAVGWAQRVVPRMVDAYGDEPGPTTTVPSAEAAEALCALVPEDRRDQILGEGWEVTGDEGGLCRFSTAFGSGVEVGPRTEPATRATLEGIERSSEVAGQPTPWGREEVTGVGTAAVLLVDPNDPARVELYALQGAAVLRVGVNAPSAEAARDLAEAVATEALSR